MENKQTAVEWLVKEIESLITIETFQKWKALKEQAKEMEKEQTEISDEEYYKDVFYQKQVMNPYPTGDQSYTAYEKGFMDFAKWYREQLKTKK